MDLKKHYNHLYSDAIEKIKTNKYTIDYQIDSTTDNRLGITVIIRPSLAVKTKLQEFINELKKNNPNQYYYSNSDIHITLLSIISCYDGFDLKTISIPEYIKIIQKSIETVNGFEINFKGVTASSSAIMIQGFIKDDSLNHLRNNLRTNFKNSSLQQSIDTRYTIQTAHSTIMRFRKEIIDKEALLETLEKHKTFDFGKFKVKNIELVHNDWYQRKQYTEQLYYFDLK